MIAASVIEFNQFFPINFTIFSFLCLCLSMHYVRKVHLVIIGPEAAEKWRDNFYANNRKKVLKPKGDCQ